jgi:ribosome-binding protein aMBF1 (putative translation factor)
MRNRKKHKPNAYAQSPAKPMQSNGIEHTSAHGIALAETQILCETAVVASTHDESADDPMTEDFASRVRRARALRGLSQAELSHLSQVDPATVFRIEKGESRAHTSTRNKLAKALRVNPEWLLSGDERLAPTSGPAERSIGPTEHKTIYQRGALPPGSEEPPDEVPEFVPRAVVMLLTRRNELNPLSPTEVRFLCTKHNLEGHTDPDILEIQLLMHRVAMSNNSPAAQEAWHAAVLRQEAEKAAARSKTANGTPSPNKLKKRKPR